MTIIIAGHCYALVAPVVRHARRIRHHTRTVGRRLHRAAHPVVQALPRLVEIACPARLGAWRALLLAPLVAPLVAVPFLAIPATGPPPMLPTSMAYLPGGYATAFGGAVPLAAPGVILPTVYNPGPPLGLAYPQGLPGCPPVPLQPEDGRCGHPSPPTAPGGPTENVPPDVPTTTPQPTPNPVSTPEPSSLILITMFCAALLCNRHILRR